MLLSIDSEMFRFKKLMNVENISNLTEHEIFFIQFHFISITILVIGYETNCFRIM